MKKSIFILGLISWNVIGCQQVEDDYTQPAKSDDKVFVAYIEDDAMQARTSLNAEGAIEWSVEDRIAVFQGEKSATQYEVSEGAGSSYAEFAVVNNNDDEFDGELVRSTIDTFDANVAFYPYAVGLSCVPAFANDALVSCAISGVNFPGAQKYVANSFPEGAFTMAAITKGVSDNVFEFKNVGGALKLQLTGTATITSIALAGNADEPLAGAATVVVYADGAVKPSVEMGDAATKCVVLDCGAEGVALDEVTPTAFIIAIPPTPFESGFTVTITNNEGATTKLSTSKPNKVERSKILSMPPCAVGFEAQESTSDLSANGTANSYIVTEAGTYKFKATQGCSDVAVGVASVSTFAHPEGVPTAAAVHWESFGTSEMPAVGALIKDAKYEDGYVHFSTADIFAKGNAVIVVTDETGTILWSWHIWLTDQPKEIVYVNNAGTVMDRNLGATSATPGDVGTLGLLYQWGRKDPFLSGDAITLNSNTVAASTKAYSTGFTSDATCGTVEYAIKNPTHFIKQNNNNYDWLYASTHTRDTSRWTKEKSIYDPCPAGWQVPEMSMWIAANGNNEIAHYLVGDRTNRGLAISSFTGTDVATWFPTAGYLMRGTGRLEQVGASADWWTVTMNESEREDYNNLPKVFRIGVSSNSNSSYTFTSSNNHSFGLSVRCVKIAE